MSGKELLIDMMAHLEWADAALWQGVLGCEGAADDERLRFLLHHIHTVQHAFWLMWRGEEKSFPALETFADGPAIAAWGRETLGEVRAWVGDATDAQLAGELHVPWAAEVEKRIGRPAVPATIAQSVAQLAIHSAHHRGQAATRLAQVGGSPPLNDFIYWTWCGRPAARWPV